MAEIPANSQVGASRGGLREALASNVFTGFLESLELEKDAVSLEETLQHLREEATRVQVGLRGLHYKHSGLSLFAFIGLCDVLAGGRFTGVWPTAENCFRIKYSKESI